MRPTCETCVFWQPQERLQGRPRSFGFAGDEDPARRGQCRRAPLLILTEQGLRTMWPMTLGISHWCGEHAVSDGA